MSSLPRPFFNDGLPRPFGSSTSFLGCQDPYASPSHYPPWYSGSNYFSEVNHQLSFNRAVPVGFKAPWSSPEVLEALHHKEDLVDRAKRFNTPQAWSQVKGQQRLVGDLVRNTNKQHFNNNNYRRFSGPSLFFCDTCDRGFGTKDELDHHLTTHITCSIGGCSFRAHPKVVSLHRKMQHATGLAEKIMGLDTPEDIRKWREERKRNFPTNSNVERKKKEQEDKVARGEVLENKYFGKMRGGRQNQRHGNQSNESEFPNTNGNSFRGRGRGRGRGRNRGRGQFGHGDRQHQNWNQNEQLTKTTVPEVNQQQQNQQQQMRQTQVKPEESIHSKQGSFHVNVNKSEEVEFDENFNGRLKRFKGTLHCYDNDEHEEDLNICVFNPGVPCIENQKCDYETVPGRGRKRNRRHNRGRQAGPQSNGLVVDDLLKTTTNEITLSSDDSDIAEIICVPGEKEVPLLSIVKPVPVMSSRESNCASSAVVIDLTEKPTQDFEVVELSDDGDKIVVQSILDSSLIVRVQKSMPDAINSVGNSVMDVTIAVLNVISPSAVDMVDISSTAENNLNKNITTEPHEDTSSPEVVQMEQESQSAADLNVQLSITDTSETGISIPLASGINQNPIDPENTASFALKEVVQIGQDTQNAAELNVQPGVTDTSETGISNQLVSGINQNPIDSENTASFSIDAVRSLPLLEYNQIIIQTETEPTPLQQNDAPSSVTSGNQSPIEISGEATSISQEHDREVVSGYHVTASKEIALKKQHLEMLEEGELEDSDEEAASEQLPTKDALRFFLANSDDSDEDTAKKAPRLSPKPAKVPASQAAASGALSLLAGYGSDSESNVEEEVNAKKAERKRPVPDLYPTRAADLKKRKGLSLLEKLLSSEIRHERNVILQCVHHTVKQDFFQ